MDRLSSSAVPRYYGRFRERVLRGEIPVSETIAYEMNRIDALIKNPGVYYDPKPIEGFISFVEHELTLTDGSPIHMLDSFKLWAEQVFGWYYYTTRTVFRPDARGGGWYEEITEKKRLTRKQYLIVARGAAKSMYASCIQQYYLVVDPSTTQGIVTAPTMKQAEETLAPVRTAIVRSRGPVYQYLTSLVLDGQHHNALASTKRGIINGVTGSSLEIRPMAIGKLQGLRPKISTVDEWLSGDIREDVIGALEQGASKLSDYLIVATTSEGTIRNASGDSVKMELMDILRGVYKAPHISIWYYRLDSVDEVGEPEKWIKANPNLGQTVLYDTYYLDVERAEKVPAARNDILAKRFGLPLEGFTYFFTYLETLPHRKKSFWQMSASLGGDMSRGDDFCSFTFLFPLGGDRFGVVTRSYITEHTLHKLPGALREKYEEFVREDSLVIMSGLVLDMMAVYEDLDTFIIKHEIDVRCFGYDPYNANQFYEHYMRKNGEYVDRKVAQGSRTESVPLGELKTLAEERLLIFDQQLMSFAMGNAITVEDTNGNRKLQKRRHDQKIDPVAALLDAYVAYKDYRDLFE